MNTARDVVLILVLVLPVKTCAETTAATKTAGAGTKGEAALLVAPAPDVAEDLPDELRRQSTLHFDIDAHDLYGAAVALLTRADPQIVGQFGDGRRRLEHFEVRPGYFRSFRSRQVLQTLVASDGAFLDAYARLLQGVVLPHLKKQLVIHAKVAKFRNARNGGVPPSTTTHVSTHPADGQGGAEGGTTDPQVLFYCQWPPTLRLQPGPSAEHGRIHRDAEFGHQAGEVNFWMPLTDRGLTRGLTLFVEDFPDSGDFRPLALDYGSIGQFHGTLCRHHTPANASGCTRASLDFRVGITRRFFDPAWHLEGVKAEHGRKLFWC